MTQRQYMDQAGEYGRLELTATKIRRLAIDNITKSKVGHPGGSMSVTDILTGIYFGRYYDPDKGAWERIMRYKPGQPLWPGAGPVDIEQGAFLRGLVFHLGPRRFLQPRCIENIHQN
jgi:hypothetical protein